jgi:hypothetical protein
MNRPFYSNHPKTGLFVSLSEMVGFSNGGMVFNHPISSPVLETYLENRSLNLRTILRHLVTKPVQFWDVDFFKSDRASSRCLGHLGC